MFQGVALPAIGPEGLARVLCVFGDGTDRSVEQLHEATSISAETIRRSVPFLRELGLAMTDGERVGATERGRRLIEAIEKGQDSEVSRQWRSALRGASVVRIVVQTIESYGTVSLATLVESVTDRLGIAKINRNRTGISSVVKLCESAGLVTREDGKLRSLSSTSSSAEEQVGEKPGIEQAPSDQKPPLKKQVFVAYSYKLYPKEDYRKVFKDLESNYDVTFIFADEKITNMHIMKKIETYIRASEFCIFDISGWNPNVTLELGFAMALGDQWYIAVDPSKTETSEVPSDLRGLDRIQYRSYSELSNTLSLLMEQRFPRRKSEGIETFIAEHRFRVRDILRDNPGQTITVLAQLLGINVGVAQLVVKEMVGSQLETRGIKTGTKYYLKGTVPATGKIPVPDGH